MADTALTSLLIAGVPDLPGIPYFGGNVWWVNPYKGSDTYDGKKRTTPFKTLDRAYAVGNTQGAYNDQIMLMSYGNSSSGFARIPSAVSTGGLVPTALGGAVWAKDGLHLIGISAGGVNPRSSVRLATTDVTSTNLFTVSGSGCYFQNINWFQGSALATAQKCLTVTGSRNVFRECVAAGMGIANATRTTAAGDRSLVFDGGSVENGENLWIGGQIGLATVPRGSVACAELECKATAARNVIIGARILTQAVTGGSNANLFISIPAYGLQDELLLVDCVMINNRYTGGAGLMAQAISVNAAPGGAVVLRSTQAQGVTKLETAASTFVFVDGVGGAATGGLMIANTG